MLACSFLRLGQTPMQLQQRIARTEKFAMTRTSSPAREARTLPRDLPDQVFLVNCGSVRWGIRVVISRTGNLCNQGHPALAGVQ
jgi:hypothetical protein